MPDAQILPDKQEENRNPSWFKPGQSGNPNGRPPKGYAISDVIRDMLDAEPEKKRQLSQKLLDLAMGGDLNAIKELLDRIEGKSVQKIEVKSTNVEQELDKLDTDYEQLASKAKRQMVALEPLIQNQEQTGPVGDVPAQPTATETHGGEGQPSLQPDPQS